MCKLFQEESYISSLRIDIIKILVCLIWQNNPTFGPWDHLVGMSYLHRYCYWNCIQGLEERVAEAYKLIRRAAHTIFSPSHYWLLNVNEYRFRTNQDPIDKWKQIMQLTEYFLVQTSHYGSGSILRGDSMSKMRKNSDFSFNFWKSRYHIGLVNRRKNQFCRKWSTIFVWINFLANVGFVGTFDIL